MEKKGVAAGEVHIVRTFQAPREIVFKAWTDPKQLGHWFAPRSCSLKIHQMDVRSNGTALTTITTNTGYECTCKTTYIEVTPPIRLVYIMNFCDLNGKFLEPQEVGADPEWPRETTVTVTFTEHDGKTEVVLHQTVSEVLAKRTGAYPSWLEMFDRLAENLAR